ncbi:hypothetical protein [Pseudonocardia sp. NPDC049635]|uniref:hypothetical protein n=1 Tax=Pseudonocardia sp. NPDC049635 TaxID=3155506 RepID=UPI0033D3DDC6
MGSASTDRGPVVGRRILMVLLALTALVHARLAAGTGAEGPFLAALDGIVAIVAGVALVMVVRGADAPALLTAAVAGGLGVALFLVPGLVAVAGGGSWTAWLDPWMFGALLLDAMVVRIAVFTLRKVGDPGPKTR